MLVFPGDEIGYSEEYLCGEGCYDADGIIKASAVGELVVDGESRIMTVNSRNKPVVLETGDVVFGKINDLRSNMAIVNVIAKEGIETRSISTRRVGTLFISQVTDGFVKDLSEFFRVGDMIKARVIKVKPSLQLSTSGEGLGVVKSFCKRCKGTMRVVGSRLQCFRCRTFENRGNISKDYCKPVGLEVKDEDNRKE